jgi:hypothetical protein
MLPELIEISRCRRNLWVTRFEWRVEGHTQVKTSQGFALISLRDMGVEEVRSQKPEWRWRTNDSRWGRIFVRICPYLPFSARVWLNQHHLAGDSDGRRWHRLSAIHQRILAVWQPGRLQQLADSLTARDLLQCGQKWLAAFTPFFTDRERRQEGCQHRLFFSQVEYCDNLIFRRRAAVEELTQRLLDFNRNIGQPRKITTAMALPNSTCATTGC